MRTSFVAVTVAIAAAGVSLAFSENARAVMAPSGAGTEQPTSATERVRPGWEVSGALGTGFSSLYGFGYEGRIGYTLPIGVYVGGQVQAFYGQSILNQKSHAAFIGGEVGYKLFPIEPLELRPYLFAGPSFITQINDNPFSVRSKTSFAIQPGALATYHIGPGFLGVDFRMFATPSPFGAALLGMAGIGF